MDKEITSLITEVGKVLSGGGIGAVVGFYAQKRAAQSDAVKEIQVIKSEYKELYEFVDKELTEAREDRKECQKENALMLDTVNGLKIEVNDLTMVMHNAIGTPKGKRKGLNKQKPDSNESN